jgi:hypothetical protein
MTKRLLIIAALATALFQSCGDGFKTSEDGLKYKIHTTNQGEKIKAGDFVTLNMVYRTDSDSVLFDTYKIGQAVKLMVVEPSFKGDLMHGLTLLSESDSGIYDAMNKGLANAQGKFICFLNSDDEFYSRFLLAKVMLAIEKDKLDIVYGDVLYQSTDGKSVRYYNSGQFSEEKIRYGLMPAHPSLFIKANIYKQIGGYNAGYKIAGDFEMCCRLIQVLGLRVQYLKMPFVKMLTGGTSSTRVSNIVLINREIRRACITNGIQTNYIKLLMRYFKKIQEYT